MGKPDINSGLYIQNKQNIKAERKPTIRNEV